MESDQADPRWVLEHAPWARRIAQAMVQDQQQAEDLAQDAIEAGLRRASAPPEGIRAWLYGTLRNLRRQAARSAGHRRERELRSHSSESVARPDELLEKVEAQRAVSDAVIRLPETLRSALILRYYEELSMRDVARALGVSERAAESRVQRGLQQLRESFESRLGAAWATVITPLLAPIPLLSKTTVATTIVMTAKSKLLLIGACVLALTGGFAAFDWLLSAEIPGVTNAASAELALPELSPEVPAELEPPLPSGDESDTMLARAAARTGLWVRVVDESGEPVVGAEVQGFTPPGRIRSAADYWGSVERHLDYREPPFMVLTDQEGRAKLCENAADFHGILFLRAYGLAWTSFSVEKTTQPLRDLGDVSLTRGGHLAFRALDGSGRPIEGVRLEFGAKLLRRESNVLRYQSALTGKDGVARFDSLPIGPGFVTCDSPSHLHWQKLDLEVSVNPVAPEDFILDEGGSATLLVVDAQGNAVHGAEAYVFSFMRQDPAGSLTPAQPEFLGETDTAGAIRISGIPDGRAVLALVRKDASWVETRVRASREAIRLALPRLRTVEGRIHRADGPLASGAQLLVVDAVNPLPTPDLVLSLGANGEFRLSLPEGSYGLAVSHPDGSFIWPEELAVTRDLDLGEIIMPPGPRLTVRCVDAGDGGAVAGVAINVARNELAPRTRPQNWMETLRTRLVQRQEFLVEASGFVARHLNPGVHHLSIAAEGYVPQVLVVELGEQPVERLIALNREARLMLTVLDADGNPMVGESIELMPAGYDPAWRMADEPIPPKVHPTNRQTDEHGRAEFTGLVPGVWRVGFWGRPVNGAPLAELLLAAGEQTHELRVPKSVRLQFEVLNNGEPVANARIRIRRALEQPADERSDGFESGGHSVETDASGRAEFECKEPGMHRLQVFARGYLPLQQELELRGDSMLIPLLLDGAELRGQVIGGGEQVEVVLLQYLGTQQGTEESRKSSARGRFVETSARTYVAYDRGIRFGFDLTTENASFRLRGVAPGTYYLLARSDGWLTSEVQTVVVEGADVDGLTMTLMPAATIVVDVSGVSEFLARRPGMELRLRYRSGSLDRGGSPFRMEKNGECRLEQLPAGSGTLEITVNDAAFTSWERLASIPVQVIAGQVTRMSWDARTILVEQDPK